MKLDLPNEELQIAPRDDIMEYDDNTDKRILGDKKDDPK